MRSVPLADIALIVSGATPKTGVAGYWDGDVEWATPADLSKLDGAYISSTPRKITPEGLASCAAQLLPVGSVLLSSRAPIGHVAINTVPMATNQGFKSFVPKEGQVDAKYLYHWLRANTDYLKGLGNGATFKELSKATVARIEIPLPPLVEQRRIVAILDQADALRAKRRQSLALLDDLTQSIFVSVFKRIGDPTHQLDVLADVSSGITKGRKLRGQVTRPVPYLAVSNVQDGHLRMDVVKDIDATAAEIARYALAEGDLVLTEGGDPDKLGRGTVWRAELPLCIHQNHVFRVRPDPKAGVLPDYLSAFMASSSARSYFLRAAKQTTGIASINMTQLRALPVDVPPLSLQEDYVSRIEALRRHRERVQLASNDLGRLFVALQSRAFSGEL